MSIFSAYERITSDLAPVIRKLSDVNVSLLGVPTSLLRLTEVERNMMGDKDFVYQASIIDNVYINFPFGEIDALSNFDTSSQSTESIYVEDLLPIIIQIPFYGSQSNTPVDLDRNDLLCTVIFDSKNNKIPILLKSPKVISSFIGRHEIQRKYQATLSRETLEDPIQEKINEYMDSIKYPDVLEVIVNGNTVELYFDTFMNLESIISNVQVSPTISVSITSNLHKDRIYLTAEWLLNTAYTITLPKTVVISSVQAPLLENYSYTFTKVE